MDNAPATMQYARNTLEAHPVSQLQRYRKHQAVGNIPIEDESWLVAIGRRAADVRHCGLEDGPRRRLSTRY
jgi:hypothetical protein